MSISVGNLTVSNNYKAAYAARFTALGSGSAINDLAVIIGSATKTIRVLRIGISGNNNIADRVVDTFLIKRSTADTGGSAPSNIPAYSSNNPSATAALAALPSGIGTTLGIVRVTKIHTPVTTLLGAAQNEYTWAFSRPSQAIVLRGTSECLAVNFNGATITGGLFNVWFEWTEE